MSTPLLPDTLWNLIQPLVPPPPRRPKGGRPRLPDRACLTGILFVLRSGIPWEMLPQELGTAFPESPCRLKKCWSWGLRFRTRCMQPHAKGIVHRDIKPANIFARTIAAARL
jgi:transposase